MAFAALPLVRAAQPSRLLEWWHLLSLDAATVAALWSYAFARAMGLHLPTLAPLLLAAGTWLVYVADRILDGYNTQTRLRKRHYFYAKHRSIFLAAATAVAGCVGWLVLTRMQPAVRREDSLLFLAAMIYFLLVHAKGRRVERWLPKELVVGVLFACATAVPTWARLTLGHSRLVPAVGCFAALCWLNCVAIEWWEEDGPSAPASGHPAHISTRWAARHLRKLAAGLALAAVLLAVLALLNSSPGLAAIYLAVFLSSSLYVWMESAAARVDAVHLRIAADGALLTPLLLLGLLRG